MADQVRIEIGFDGGQSLSMLVSAESADALAQGIGQDGSVTLDADDGASYIVALRRVVYVRRFQRQAKVGFGVA
jgi:hypothetical protein